VQALTNDEKLMGERLAADCGPKVSMKKLFERPKTKVDGTPSKVRARPHLSALCFLDHYNCAVYLWHVKAMQVQACMSTYPYRASQHAAADTALHLMVSVTECHRHQNLLVQVKELPPMEQLQTDEATRARWIFYSALDAKATWELYNALKVT